MAREGIVAGEGVVTRIGGRDAARGAAIVRRRPLRYREGADPALERPAHVRAASGLVAYGDTLAIVQDDALFVAFADPLTGLCGAVTLPARHGARTFDARRGNKKKKPDLESLLRFGERLVGLPSGSAPGRDQLVVLDPGAAPRWFDGSALYGALARSPGFAGGELNVEASRVEGDEVWLFNRGNGASPQVDARCVLDRAGFEAWLSGGPTPRPVLAETWSLGAIAGVRLTFTDVTEAGPALFSAAAEASPNAVDDGHVAGVAIGALADGGWAQVTEAGAPISDKIEGISWLGDRLFAVTDPDDPDQPGELLEIALSGRWR